MDYGELGIVLVAVAIAFFAKGLTGIGGPLFAVPVLAPSMGVEAAVAVITIPTLVANIWLLWQHHTAAATVRRYLVPLLIAGSIGIVLGVWLLVNIDDRWLSLAVALVVIVYIIWYLANPSFQLTEQAAERLSAPVGLVSGSLQGATGISAPVLATYLHSLKLPRTSFIIAVTIPFAVLGAVQMVSLAAVGAYEGDLLLAGAIAIIPAMIALPLGSSVGERVSQRTFQVLVLVILAFTAVRLLWSVFAP